MMAYSLLGLLICNILTLIAIAVSGAVVAKRVAKLTADVQGPIKEMQLKVNTVVQATQPVIEHVRATTKSVSEGVQSARRVVGNVEETVANLTNPQTIASTAAGILRLPAARVGLVSLILGAAAKLLHGRMAQPRGAATRTLATDGRTAEGRLTEIPAGR